MDVLRFNERLTALIDEAVTETYALNKPFPFDILLESPKESVNGDVSSNIAMILTRVVKKAPMAVAEELVSAISARIDSDDVIKPLVNKIVIAKPGFINLFLSNRAFEHMLKDIVSKGADYGRSDLGQAEKVQVEFVSANPTGPLTVAHGRQAAVGDSLANILDFAGFNVTREYYLNDEGRQMELLAKSIYSRYLDILGVDNTFPQDGYKGDYIKDIAAEVHAKHGDKFKGALDLDFFLKYGCDTILATIKDDLTEFRVGFDIYTSQAEVCTVEKIEDTLGSLRKKGLVYDKDGAVWFKSMDFEDDKDRVVKKATGEYTYLAADIVYHAHKLERDFDRLVNIWGPDHHGYINRIKAAVTALGGDPAKVDILIIQLAKLFKGKEVIPMSTRAGKFITLRQVFEEVGVDAGRYFFAMRKRESHLDFDLELAKKHSPENPVYYIQYAHARICSIYGYKDDVGSQQISPDPEKVDLALLNTPEEEELLRKLRQFSEAIATAVRQLDPCPVTVYLLDLAKSFHSYYTKCKVVTDDAALTSARLLLVGCIRTVLANGLALLGISAPEKM